MDKGINNISSKIQNDYLINSTLQNYLSTIWGYKIIYHKLGYQKATNRYREKKNDKLILG